MFDMRFCFDCLGRRPCASVAVCQQATESYRYLAHNIEYDPQ